MEAYSLIMYRKNDSLTFVINGDWNKLYIQPEWIAKNVFKVDTIEVTLMGKGNDIILSFKYQNVSITPSQSQVIFSISNITQENKEYLCFCVNNFIKDSYSPQIISYGLNSDYSDNGERFAYTIDSMSDNQSIYEAGGEILSTEISRTINYKNQKYNVDSIMEGAEVTVHINEHHGTDIKKEELIAFNSDRLDMYLDNCWDLINALGYEREESD